MALLRLPSYPSARSRKSLTPSQSANLNQLILSSLEQCLNLSIENLDPPSTQKFISSYAKDVAARLLHALIWEDPKSSKSNPLNLSQVERAIHYKVLLLSKKLLGSLDFETLVDLSVSYGLSNPKQLRTIFAAAYLHNTKILESQVSDAVPAFTSLLESSAQGLYGIRKLSHVILSCLRPAPAPLKLIFARDKAFILSLAKAYDQGLSLCAQSYGGFRLPTVPGEHPVEDWERLFLDTKVALLDTFHILLHAIFDDVAAVQAAGRELATRCEPAFEVIFALLELPPSQVGSTSTTREPTPFLNQSLLSDYQHAYDLSRTFVSVLRQADSERTQLLEHALSSLDTTDAGNPGALKLIIRSSGISPGIDYKGKGPSRQPVDTKGKGKAVETRPPIEENPELDAAVAQVLDILPDQPAPYIRYLLGHPDYPYKGNAERLIEAIFEGAAPSVEDVDAAVAREATPAEVEVEVASQVVEREETRIERRNVFEDERMDLTQVRYGKKEEAVVAQDRSFMEQMKADILRRVEEATYSDEDEDLEGYGDKAKGKEKDIAFEDALDEEGGVTVRDGEPSDDQGSSTEGEGEEEGEDESIQRPETILEVAYLRDPKLFDRDAQTRRSKARADLKTQTGWNDEQIEGWRIMLERNPKKDKILQKHEFSGNVPLPPPAAGPSQPPRGGGRGRGRGRGGGGGRGRGRGGQQGGVDGARDRQSKERRGNQKRKAGHDKKMARAGGPPPS